MTCLAKGTEVEVSGAMRLVEWKTVRGYERMQLEINVESIAEL